MTEAMRRTGNRQKWRLIMPAAGVLLLLMALVAAHAEEILDQDAARRALEAGEVVPLHEITAVVARQFTGEMVEAELEHKPQGWFYEITLLTADGSILRLHYAAKSETLVQARGHGIERWYKGDPALLRAAQSHCDSAIKGLEEDDRAPAGVSSAAPAAPGGFWSRLFGKSLFGKGE